MIRSRQHIVTEQHRLIQMHPMVQDRLKRFPGVEHIGVGVKETKGELTAELCFRVYVAKKLERDQLRTGDVLPRYIMGVKTDVIESGTVFQTANPDTTKYHSVRGGAQIRNEFFEGNNTVGAGTIGIMARTTDASNKLVGLSAKHVLLDGLTGSPLPTGVGTKVGHPRWIKCCCCCSYNEIGKVLLTSATLDCGIVEIDSGAASKVAEDNMENGVLDIGEIDGVAQAVCYEVVKKRGAATRLTRGVVVDVLFEGDKILINPCADYPNFNEPGDSGAVIVNGMYKVVGLLVGASRTESNKGVALHIKPVLEALNIKIAGQDATTAGLTGVPAANCVAGGTTTCVGGTPFPLSASAAYFRELDDGTLYLSRQPGFAGDANLQQRRDDIFGIVVPALSRRVFENPAESNSWEERARFDAVPPAFIVDPVTDPDLDAAMRRLSTYQLDLMRSHFPGPTAGSIDATKVRISFERFMNGELRERPSGVHPYGPTELLRDGPREPNGSFEMMFSAFAWMAIENNVDAATWTPLYNAMVQCQEMFMFVYRRRPQVAPPAGSLPMPVFTVGAAGNSLEPLDFTPFGGSPRRVRLGETGFGDSGFSFDHFNLDGAGDVTSTTSIAQSNEARKVFLRAKYAAFDYPQTKNAMKENIQRMLYMT
jgi:hypothetical protein